MPKKKNRPTTSHSPPQVDAAGIDILLVGDSLGMVVHGHDTTLPVTLDDMVSAARAAARGARRPFLVGDLPFGSYEEGPSQAVRSAVRLLKEGGMDAVKLEGGGAARVAAARAVVDAGVAVFGHVGLMPQAISVLGGFRPQGRSPASALRVLAEARALEAAGCAAVVLECVPSAVAAAVTAALSVPTIGIGAGPATSGQVLVYHDLLGMMAHPHYRKVTPKFCRRYADAGAAIQAPWPPMETTSVLAAFPPPPSRRTRWAGRRRPSWRRGCGRRGRARQPTRCARRSRGMRRDGCGVVFFCCVTHVCEGRASVTEGHGRGGGRKTTREE